MRWVRGRMDWTADQKGVEMKDRLVAPRAQAVVTEPPEHVDGDPGRHRGEQMLPATGRARVLAATALVLLVVGVVGLEE